MDQTETIVSVFLSPQTVLVCLAIYVMTYVIRRIVETTWKEAATNRYWRELAVPLGPIVNGVFIGLVASKFVWPEMIGSSLSGRIMYGAVCGLFSAHLYNRIRAWTKAKQAAKASGKPDSMPPPTIESLPPMAEETPSLRPPPEEMPAIVDNEQTIIKPFPKKP